MSEVRFNGGLSEFMEKKKPHVCMAHTPRHMDDCFLYFQHVFHWWTRGRTMASVKNLFLGEDSGFWVPIQNCGLAICYSIGSVGFKSKMIQGGRMGILAAWGWNMPQEPAFAISVVWLWGSEHWSPPGKAWSYVCTLVALYCEENQARVA